MVAAVALCAPGVASATVAPSIAGFVSDAGDLSGALSVAVSGHYAYTTGYFSGRLAAIDISNPRPILVGASPYAASLQGASTVNIVGGYAYVASKNRNASTSSNDDGTGDSLTILDVSTNPAQPAIVGSLHDPVNLFGAYGVAVAGGYAYVAAQGLLPHQPSQPDNGTGRFDVISVSNHTSPSIVATLDDSSLPAPWTGTGALRHGTAVAISGQDAYVTSPYSNRLTVIDISNPLSPRIVGSLQDPTALGFDVDVAVHGKYAYVVDQSTSDPTLAVVDVSDPAHPHVTGTLSSSFLKGAYRVRVRGDFAYVASTVASTLTVIDISDPRAPRLAAGVYDNLTHLHSASGLDLDSTGRYAIVSSPLLASESSSVYPPFPFQTGGPTVTGTITTIDLDPSPISVRISAASTPANPSGATKASFRFAANDAVAAVLCELDGRAPGPCTSTTSQRYRSLRRGRHTFTVRATDAAGRVATARYRWVIGPRVSKVKLSPRRQLVPRGRPSTIGSLLKKGGYAASLKALGPGVARIDWYYLPKGAHLFTAPGHPHKGSERRKGPSPVLPVRHGAS
jgi:hypothetical protein